jgi:hypothetical protein
MQCKRTLELKQAASLLAYSLVLKMEVICSSETLIDFTGLQGVQSQQIQILIFSFILATSLTLDKVAVVTKLETYFLR